MLTAREVEELLLEHRFDWQVNDDWETDWDGWSEASDPGPLTTEVVGLGTVKVWEHDFGGVETNLAHLLFEVDGRLFRKEGRWVSHCGMYWDGSFAEVKPIQRVITDYEEL